MEILKFIYEETEIEFELGSNLKVNATEMAKKFDKDVPDFMILKQTKEFISECLKNQNSGYLGIEKEEDLYTSKQNAGTWMHKILALKFAAWLNPAFELWIYKTIDQILNRHFSKVKEVISEKKIIEDQIKKKKELLQNNETFIEYTALLEKQRILEHKKNGALKSANRQLTLEL